MWPQQGWRRMGTGMFWEPDQEFVLRACYVLGPALCSEVSPGPTLILIGKGRDGRQEKNRQRQGCFPTVRSPKRKINRVMSWAVVM